MKLWLLAATIAISAWLLTTEPALAHGEIDQQTGPNWGSGHTGPANSRWGQIFTPTQPELVAVDVAWCTGSGVPEPRTINIRPTRIEEVTAAGPAGTVIDPILGSATVTLPGSLIHAMQFTHVDFNPPVVLTPGQLYAISMDNVAICGSSSGDEYPGGELFFGMGFRAEVRANFSFRTYGPVPADTTPPAAPTVTGGPADGSTVGQNGASFIFSATESGVTFLCSLDSPSFTACSSPQAYTGLTDGSHTFAVKAKDAANNESAAITRTWTIDTTPPDTTIATSPADPTNSTSARFTLTATEAGSTFECSLDAGTFGACASPHGYSGLAAGNHTFRVRAVDPTGNVDQSEATFSWQIDLRPPRVSFGTGIPNEAAWPITGTVTIPFVADEPGATFECLLDSGPLTACSSPMTYANLSDGVHRFQVRPIDPAGNVGAATTPLTWISFVDSNGNGIGDSIESGTRQFSDKAVTVPSSGTTDGRLLPIAGVTTPSHCLTNPSGVHFRMSDALNHVLPALPGKPRRVSGMKVQVFFSAPNSLCLRLGTSTTTIAIVRGAKATIIDPDNTFTIDVEEGSVSVEAVVGGQTTTLSVGTGGTLTYTEHVDANGHVQSLDVVEVAGSVTLNGQPVTPGTTLPANSPPTAGAGGPYTAKEGGAIAFGSTATDPDGDAVTISWTVTADAGTDAGAACQVTNGTTLAPTITCNDDGSYTARLTVSDGKTAPVTSDASVTVTNAAPTITALVGPTNAVTGVATTFTGTASDPSSLDTAAGFSWHWATNGGAYLPFGVPNANTFKATFPTCGDQTVSAKARDDGAGVSTPVTASVVKAYDVGFEAAPR